VWPLATHAATHAPPKSTQTRNVERLWNALTMALSARTFCGARLMGELAWRGDDGLFDDGGTLLPSVVLVVFRCSLRRVPSGVLAPAHHGTARAR